MSSANMLYLNMNKLHKGIKEPYLKFEANYEAEQKSKTLLERGIIKRR